MIYSYFRSSRHGFRNFSLNNAYLRCLHHMPMAAILCRQCGYTRITAQFLLRRTVVLESLLRSLSTIAMLIKFQCPLQSLTSIKPLPI